jgi:hypothetical protein
MDYAGLRGDAGRLRRYLADGTPRIDDEAVGRKKTNFRPGLTDISSGFRARSGVVGCDLAAAI